MPRTKRALILFAVSLSVLLAIASAATWLPVSSPLSVAAKEKPKKDKGENDANKGHGNDPDKHDEDNPGKGKKSEETPIVAEPSATALPVPTPRPSPTPSVQPGGLRMLPHRCDGLPADDQWQQLCTVADTAARFQVTALEGAFAGWSIDVQAGADGAASLANLPAGRYRLDQIGADWCHAESDRVDANGDLVVAAGAVTTVWTYTCAPMGGS